MLKAHFKIITYGGPEYKAAVCLREAILRHPFGLKFSAEELESERSHIQIAGFLNHEVVATAVLVPELPLCKMKRVVVKSSLQSQGIGTQLMQFCKTQAKSLGFKTIYCHARDTAVSFYRKNEYASEGDFFEEDTIPHLKMVKQL